MKIHSGNQQSNKEKVAGFPQQREPITAGPEIFFVTQENTPGTLFSKASKTSLTRSKRNEVPR